MSVKRFIAVGIIFLLACAGWWTLGVATTMRTGKFHGRLGPMVEEMWGAPLGQKTPSVTAEIPGSERVRPVMPAKNLIKVDLKTDYRKKGLIWHPTYVCAFDGTYTITNNEAVAQKIRIHFDFPATNGTYDDFVLSLNNEQLASPINPQEGANEMVELAPGQSTDFRVCYTTRGIREWRYLMPQDVGRVQNLDLTVQTDFRKVDYPDGSLSPMSSGHAGNGMMLAWQATDLITRQDIGVIIPEKLNPGPLISRITFFAPVCLIFFFVLVATINILYKVDIHPMHYLFVAAGFFAFHLLLAYMAGLVNTHLAFVISAIVSVALVTSYLSTALKGKFPWKVAAAGQVFFLVLFSYSFFLKGITGLTVAIGSVVTLAVLMKVTAHIDWSEVFSQRTVKANAVIPPPIVQVVEVVTEDSKT